jgi:hypothetical protein
MIKKVAVIALVIVASLSLAGCTFPISTSSPTPMPTPTPTATPTPVVDYSSVLTKQNEAGVGIMERPFTKSTNERGNDVYKGVGRNASKPGSKSVIWVIELTKSQAEAKQLYDKYVAQRLNEGYTPRPDWVAGWNHPGAWAGVQYSSGNQFTVFYRYNSAVNSWDITTETL